MKNRTTWIALTAVGCVLGALGINGSEPSAPKGPEPLPRGVEGRLLHAQRFTLAVPATHYWRREQPRYSSGWLAVIQADPIRLRVSQGPMPILFVGNQTADRVNFGEQSGCVVCIIPGDFDLAQAPIYFGAPGIPESIGAQQIARERTAAHARDIRVTGNEAMLKVVADDLRFQDEEELRQAATDLIERFSPQERDLIQGMRVPLIR